MVTSIVLLGIEQCPDAFDQLLKGCCFYLFLQDNAGLDVGTLASWQVHTLNERAVPAVSSTWSAIKGVRHSN